MGEDTITLPDGTKVERFYECADCGHISDTHDSKDIGAQQAKTCELCKEPALMLKKGEPIN